MRLALTEFGNKQPRTVSLSLRSIVSRFYYYLEWSNRLSAIMMAHNCLFRKFYAYACRS